MNDKKIETVEINGVKYDVVIDEAKRIESFCVGDNIRVLVKEYSDTWKSYLGVIIGFDDFKDFPNIRIAYIEQSYSNCSIKYIDINPMNEEKEKYKIANIQKSDVMLNKSDVIEMLENEILKKDTELREAKRKKQFFIDMFSKHFEEGIRK